MITIRQLLKFPTAIKKPSSAAPVMPNRGFGDTVARATKVVGIEPCGGCGKRQEYLNKIFPKKGK